MTDVSAPAPLVPHSDVRAFGEAVCLGPRMRELFHLCRSLARTEVSLFLQGEAGTGKGLIARAIHQHSARSRQPLVVVDCGATARSRLERELFGCERSPFPGAFELARGGTLLLDEVCELPLPLQPSLLRALETRSLRRLGGGPPIQLDVRILGASRRDLGAEVARGKFHADLHARLGMITLDLPPLRERKDDIPAIAHHLVAKLDDEARAGLPALTLEPRVTRALLSHDWPGNVRELRNVIERAVQVSRAQGLPTLALHALPVASGTTASEADRERRFVPGESYREARSRFESSFEREYVTWLLERHSGNVSAAARESAMDRKHLHKLARKHRTRA